MSLQLKVVSGEDVSYLKLSEIHMVYYAQPGAVYTLVDAEGNVVTEDLELRHHLDKLEIIHEDAPVAVLEDFYAPSEQPAAYAFEEVGESNVDDLQDNSAISGGDVGAEPGVVWNSEIASLNENVATTDLGLESSVVAEPVIASDYDTSTSDDVSFSLTENTNVLYTTLGVVGAAGVAALASGGGSGGGDSGSPADSGNSAGSNSDTSAPVFTSGSSATAINENSGSGQAVYRAVANDEGSVTYSLSNTDNGAFSINGSSGVVTLTQNPDYETQSSYSFTVTVTDSEGNSSTQNVNLAINDIDDTPPVITSGATATAIDENSGSGQVVYTATATDANSVGYSISGSDASLFSLDSNTGVVTLKANPDYETQSSYSFTIQASDSLGNVTLQDVTLAINDVVEIDPSVVVFDLTSGESSDHSGQSFDANTSYSIYIVADSDTSSLSLTDDAKWDDAQNLGADDSFVLVGINGVTASFGSVSTYLWYGSPIVFADVHGTFSIGPTAVADLWNGTVANSNINQSNLLSLPTSVSV
ncbi:cadherin repeat domain-containing protein [Vibrio sp. WJH972]